jgi:hypothetical protein
MKTKLIFLIMSLFSLSSFAQTCYYSFENGLDMQAIEIQPNSEIDLSESYLDDYTSVINIQSNADGVSKIMIGEYDSESGKNKTFHFNKGEEVKAKLYVTSIRCE